MVIPCFSQIVSTNGNWFPLEDHGFPLAVFFIAMISSGSVARVFLEDGWTDFENFKNS
jgi:hypothetical protein